MDQIAFVIGETFLYWNSIIMTLAVAVAICFFLAFYLRFEGKGLAAAAVIPLAIVFSLVISRFFHWYSRADSYAGFDTAMTNYSTGGYALLGTFAGCLLTALVVWLLGMERRLGRMLDSMCLGGAAGIAVGRLACFYSAADRGQILTNFTKLPWAYPVTNAVSGVVEYRLATFLLQAMITALFFVGLVVFSRSRKRRDGDITFLFIMLYGASQVVMDSTRYDSLYFRSNGFVSIVQVVGAVAMAVSIVVFSVRLVKNRGFRKWYLALWIPIAALLGLGGYMEYHVQRHGDQALFAYSVMGSCLTAIMLIAIGIYLLGRKKVQRAPQGRFSQRAE